MNTKMLVYCRQDVVRLNNLSNAQHLMFDQLCRQVVAIEGPYSSLISGIRLSRRIVRTYHDTNFKPEGVLVGEETIPIIGRVNKGGNHYAYELAGSQEIRDLVLSATDMVEPGDVIFQVGVRSRHPETVSVGRVEKLTKYVSKEEDLKIDPHAESGSAIFTDNGRLLGMTLGKIAPNVMAGLPTVRLV
jgi:hypothetical protein